MSFRNKIVLSLGLIALHVAMDSAVSDEKGLKIVCVGDDPAKPHEPTPIKQNPACPKCHNANFGTFKKAQVDGTAYTVVEADEVAAVKEQSVGATKTTIAMTPHDAEEVHTHTIQDGSVYYLTPNKGAEETYALIVETLREHPEIALLAQWTPVSRTNLYEIKLFGDTLVMEQRARTDAIKVVQVPVTPANPMFKTQMAMLLPTMVQPFDPATYADTYRTQLEALLASKGTVEGAATATGSAASLPTNLMDQLNAMLAAAPATPAPKKKKGVA